MKDRCNLYQKNITLEQAMLGAHFKIRMENGQMIRVKLKPGLFNGQVIRLKAIPEPASQVTKDTYIKLKVLDHPHFRVDGLDLHAALLLTPAEAERGTVKKIGVPSGKKIDVVVPPKSAQADAVIIKNAGLSDKSRTGHIIFNIKIDFLEYIDEAEIIADLADRERIMN